MTCEDSSVSLWCNLVLYPLIWIHVLRASNGTDLYLFDLLIFFSGSCVLYRDDTIRLLFVIKFKPYYLIVLIFMEQRIWSKIEHQLVLNSP